MKSYRFLAAVVITFLLIGTSSITSAANMAGIGTPTMYVRPTTTLNVSEIVVDGVTNGGISGNGAAAFTVWFTLPSSVTSSAFSIEAGPAWIAQNCNFTTNVSSQPPIGGRNTFQLDGTCTASASGPRVTGSDIVVARVSFSSTVCGAFPTGFTIDITAEGENTSLFEPDGTPYIFPESALTDGSGCSIPTAVTMSGMEAATNNAAPFAAASWPMLAGLGAVAAGGVYALARRKR